MITITKAPVDEDNPLLEAKCPHCKAEFTYHNSDVRNVLVRGSVTDKRGVTRPTGVQTLQKHLRCPGCTSDMVQAVEPLQKAGTISAKPDAKDTAKPVQ